jgi:hypothetical protein
MEQLNGDNRVSFNSASSLDFCLVRYLSTMLEFPHRICTGRSLPKSEDRGWAFSEKDSQHLELLDFASVATALLNSCNRIINYTLDHYYNPTWALMNILPAASRIVSLPSLLTQELHHTL